MEWFDGLKRRSAVVVVVDVVVVVVDVMSVEEVMTVSEGVRGDGGREWRIRRKERGDEMRE